MSQSEKCLSHITQCHRRRGCHHHTHIPFRHILHNLIFSPLHSCFSSVRVTIRFGLQERNEVDTGPDVFSLDFSEWCVYVCGRERAIGVLDCEMQKYCIWRDIDHAPLFKVSLPDSVKSENAYGEDSSCNCESTGTFDWNVALVTDRLVSALWREISVDRLRGSVSVSNRVWCTLAWLI